MASDLAGRMRIQQVPSFFGVRVSKTLALRSQIAPSGTTTGPARKTAPPCPGLHLALGASCGQAMRKGSEIGRGLCRQPLGFALNLDVLLFFCSCGFSHFLR